MALTKIPRGLLDTGIADSSDATAITIDSSEIATFAAKIHANKGVNFYTTDDQANYWVQYTHTDDSLRINYNGLSTDEIVVNTSGATTFNSSITSATNKIVNTNGFFAANLAECDDDRMALLISPTRSTVTDAITLGRMANHSGIQAHDTSDDTAQNFLINPYGGNVGIGLTSPTAKLHIEVADNTEFLKATITGNEAWAFKGASGSGATDYVSFGISGGTQAMIWQEDGTVGIGTTSLTPWASGYKSLQIGDRGFVAAHTGSDLYVGQNAYVDSGWKYEASVAASLTQHSGGQITHKVAAAGTAGNAISWTDALHIDTGAHVGIKTTTEADGTAMTSPLTISGANDGGNIFESHRTANSIHRQYMSTGGSSYIDIYGTTPILKLRIGGSDVLDVKSDALNGIHFFSGSYEYTSSMDNLKTAGFYRINNGNLNQPISGNYGAACVFGNQGNVTTQIWSQLQTSNLYVRSFNNAWSSWTAL